MQPCADMALNISMKSPSKVVLVATDPALLARTDNDKHEAHLKKHSWIIPTYLTPSLYSLFQDK